MPEKLKGMSGAGLFFLGLIAFPLSSIIMPVALLAGTIAYICGYRAKPIKIERNITKH